MMGRESVDYHRATVLERGDDYPGRALVYYASRGETPLVWGGCGADGLGLAGMVDGEGYEAIYGLGGARHPVTGERLVSSQRPGMELVISAHKSVAELGVIGRAEHMHLIMDAERDATLAYLDRVTAAMGGRRGRVRAVSETGGLVYAHTRHATSRAGDPCPHDHVLVANVVEMRDARGGCKAPDTVLWREHLHAATMVGRAASARVAVDLGYGIEPDPGPSGRLGHWRIAGVPDEVIEVHSKRAAEITAECERRGDSGYRARTMAARATRKAKQPEAVEAQLVERWQTELSAIGWPVERLSASIGAAAAESGQVDQMGLRQARLVLSEILGPDSDLARRKVFFRRDVIVAVAPYLYGQDPRLVEALADRALADPETIPLIGVPGARERPYTLASVVAREVAIAECVARQIDRTDAPAVSRSGVQQAVTQVEADLEGLLSDEQRHAVAGICASGRGAELVIGVAGAGKTTMLRAVSVAFDQAGYRVLGTATSGQAARNLHREADLGQTATLAAMTWRLDHGQLSLDDRCMVVLDEAGMTDDIALARLCAYIEAARAKLVLVGDHRQLAAIGPGGALRALVTRHPDAVHRLVDNRRQHDPQERQILAELRDGDLGLAVAWYLQHDRIHPVSDRDAAIKATVEAWAADVAAGKQTSMYAWRRTNVAALNHTARAWMEQAGRLHGPEVICPGGNAYRAGDQVVTLAPGLNATLVTSEPGIVEAVDATTGALVIRTHDGRAVTLAGDQASTDRLGYGYATTVHRAQGATIARAHLFADGGGRELAYVAMSRARESTHIWALADNTAQAVEDLRRDWDNRRNPTWAIDLATSQPQRPKNPPSPQEQDQRARQLAVFAAKAATHHQATASIRAPDLTQQVAAAQHDLQQALNTRADLERGVAPYHHEAGLAVRDLQQAQIDRQQAEEDALQARSWRQRRAATEQHAIWTDRVTDAQKRYQLHVTPELRRLDEHIATRRAALEQVETQRERYHQAEQAIAELNHAAATTLSRMTAQLATHRNHIDGLAQPAAARATRGLPTRQVQPHPPAVTAPTPPPSQPGISL
jgi:conjugative relaxase-like TrwC/TraI family protein